ncbi:hypothetical protein B7R22_04885 [Subtercola boreus]|uniref:Uncharacterized protein n=1 Tax=Subtercola boreus TaxID=120213 RepID=A0A3E0W1A3_9MICO|nr:hypothetical protein [Subtercola boreus]RFA16072.1 hypothetical protein B7R22_04885 [Subtercola boreus]
MSTAIATYGVTSTIDESDFIAWATCDDGSGPSRIGVTASMDRFRSTLELRMEIPAASSDQHCILTALSTAADSHVAFFPQKCNPRVDSYFLEGAFIVDGIVVT